MSREAYEVPSIIFVTAPLVAKHLLTPELSVTAKEPMIKSVVLDDARLKKARDQAMLLLKEDPHSCALPEYASDIVTDVAALVGILPGTQLIPVALELKMRLIREFGSQITESNLRERLATTLIGKRLQEYPDTSTEILQTAGDLVRGITLNLAENN